MPESILVCVMRSRGTGTALGVLAAALAWAGCSYDPPEAVHAVRVLFGVELEGDRVPVGWLKLDLDDDGEVDRTLYVWHDRTWTLGDETDVEFTNVEVASGEVLDDGTLEGFPADALSGATEAWVEGDVEILLDGVPVPRG